MIANGKNFLSLAALIFATCKRRITLQILAAYAKKTSPLRLNPCTRERIMKKHSKGLVPGIKTDLLTLFIEWINGTIGHIMPISHCGHSKKTGGIVYGDIPKSRK